VGQLLITSAFLVPTELCPSCFCFEIFLCQSAVFPPGFCICCLIQFPPASRCRLLAGPGIQGTGKHKKSNQPIYFTLLCAHIVFQFNLHYTTTRANYATGKKQKKVIRQLLYNACCTHNYSILSPYTIHCIVKQDFLFYTTLMIGQLVRALLFSAFSFFIFYIFLLFLLFYRNNESPMCKFYTLQYNNISHHNQQLILYTDTLSYYCIINMYKYPLYLLLFSYYTVTRIYVSPTGPVKFLFPSSSQVFTGPGSVPVPPLFFSSSFPCLLLPSQASIHRQLRSTVPCSEGDISSLPPT
jgi:hypothetical protein